MSDYNSKDYFAFLDYPINNSVGIYKQRIIQPYHSDYICHEIYTSKYGKINISFFFYHDFEHEYTTYSLPSLYITDKDISIYLKPDGFDKLLLFHDHKNKIFYTMIGEVQEAFTKNMKDRFHPVTRENDKALFKWFDNSHQIPNNIALSSLEKAEKVARDFFNLPKSKISSSLDRLSFDNIRGIRELNYFFQFYPLTDLIDMGLLDPQTGPVPPYLDNEQLINLSNKLAGEEGERLVNKAVKIDSKKFHNIILDYNYGSKQNTYSNNQIDNIFVTHTGIYCIEVKTRNINHGIFDMKNLYDQNIKDQIGYHKAAVLKILRDSNNKLRDSLPKNLSSLVFSIVVLVNRNNKDFKIINTSELTNSGAYVLKINDLNLTMTNGLRDDIYLTDEQINKISKVIDSRNEGIKGERLYSDNILFFPNPTKEKYSTLNENDILERLAKAKLYNQELLTRGLKENKDLKLTDKEENQYLLLKLYNSPVVQNFISTFWTGDMIRKYKTFGLPSDMASDMVYNLENPLNLPDITTKDIEEHREDFAKQRQFIKDRKRTTFDDPSDLLYIKEGKELDEFYKPIQEAEDKKSVEKATSFNKSNSEINDFLEQKSQGSSCLSSAALIALIVGIIPALLHMLL